MANEWDGVLKEAFGRSEDQSVLESIERSAGIRARILLHDTAEDSSPILRVGGTKADGAADDSRYQVLGEIARGGVGIVFKGRDKNLGRNVALKVLRPRHSDNAEVVQRFLEEAQIGGQLQHPGIVPIYGLGLQDDGRPYFAMKLIKGETLAVMLNDRASPDVDRRRFLGIFEQICQTLAYAHSRGVVHRDLKPANVMVGNFGEVQVVDWGFAKVLGRDNETPVEPDVTMIATVRTEAEGSQSIAGSVMGTPAYMPPEQAMGQIDMLDERSDVFALGAVLCELLTGKPPYVGEINDQLLLASQARLDDAHKRLDACGADAELVALCKSAMAPTRGERPRNAAALAAGIGEHLSAVEERARAAEVASATAKAAAAEQETLERQAQLESEQAHRARRRVMTLTAAVLLVAIGGGVTYSMLAGARRDRVADAVKAVTAEIGKARRLQGAGEWDEAQRAATGAVALAKAGRVDDATAERAAATLRDVNHGAELAAAEAARLQTNRDFLARLEEVREYSARAPIPIPVDRAYAEGYAEFGLDPSGAPDEAIAKLKRMGVELVPVAVSLDSWHAMRKRWTGQLGDRPRESLLAVARAIDPDPDRNRLRALDESEDVEELAEFAAGASDMAVPTVLLLSTKLRHAGLKNEAVGMLEPHVLRHPSSFWLRWRYGAALMRIHEIKDGMVQVEAAIALRPDSGGAWYDLGLCFGAFRNLDEAERCYLRAGEIIGPNWRTLMLLGITYCRQGRIEEAIAVLREANKHTDHQLDVPQWLAIHLWSDDRHEEAMSVMRMTVDRGPQWWGGHRDLSTILMRFGRIKEALDEATIAKKIAPDQLPDRYVDVPRRMLEIEPYLEAVLAGSLKGHSSKELVEFGQLCFFHRRFEESVRLFKAAESLDSGLQFPDHIPFRAAEAAVRAADIVDATSAKAYRAYALRWLRKELRRAEAKIGTLESREGWDLGDSLNKCMFRTGELKSVRPDHVDRLPADEREAWAELWRDFTDVMHHAWETADG
ncbi:MAG: serine/threonine-protein kinase [Planctomycetota bacterium]